MRVRIGSIALLLALFVAPSAQAGHHSWDITELYSAQGGNVQYIEIFCPVNGEAGLGPFGITSTTNSMNFVTNLAGTTANTWVLVATANFGSFPGGIQPDYLIPANFFPTAGGTINYAGGADVWNYGAVPTNGVLALQRAGGTAVNSPRNFAGASGSVTLGTAVPATQSWGLLALIAAALLLASGLLRRRTATAA